MITLSVPSTTPARVSPPTPKSLKTKLTLVTGDDGLTEYILRNDKNPFMAQTDDTNRSLMLKAPTEWKKRLRVYFPSGLTVRTAHSHPEETAGTICFQKKWYDRSDFPRDILRDCESERGVLMHNKVRSPDWNLAERTTY